MAKTGRPRKNSVEAFAAAVDACIAAFEATDDAIDLTDAALAKRLNISIDRLDRYYMGEPDAAIARTRAADSSTDSGEPLRFPARHRPADAFSVLHHF